MKICIIGTGYVGLVTGTCLADFGLSVTCVDQDETKISLLNKESKVIFIAVGTPSNSDGSANLAEIEEVAKQIALSINNYKVIVIKSTVPVGTTHKINEIIIKKQVHPSLRATEGSAAIPSNLNLNRRTGVSSVYNVIATFHLSFPRKRESILLSLRGAKRRSNLNLLQNPLTLTSSPTPNSSARAQQSMTLPTLIKLNASTPWQ